MVKRDVDDGKPMVYLCVHVVLHYLAVFVNCSEVLLTMKWEHEMGELLGKWGVKFKAIWMAVTSLPGVL